MLGNKEKTREQIIEEKVKIMCDYLEKYYDDKLNGYENSYIEEMSKELDIEVLDIKLNRNLYLELIVQTSYDNYVFLVCYSRLKTCDNIYILDINNNYERFVVYDNFLKR